MAGYGHRHPSVTVIVRAHDAAATLNRALNCLAAQTQRGLQVLVVDAASTDEAKRMLATAEERDAMLECLHIDSESASDCFNLGLERAEGTYAFLMDATDTLAPRTLEELYEVAEEGSLDLAMAAVANNAHQVAADGPSPYVYADDDAFHAEAWKYFDAGLLPFPCGKLFRMDRVRKSGAKFASDGGTAFMAAFLMDAHGVAYVRDAIYNAGDFCLSASLAWDLSHCWTDEHEQDLLDNLFAHWGMDEDSQTRRMLQRRYVTNVITTIVSTCSPACGLSEDEKRAHVERIITSDKTQKIASEAAPWSGVVRAMLMPIRRKDVDLAMGEGRIISWISRHTTTLGFQLFS